MIPVGCTWWDHDPLCKLSWIFPGSRSLSVALLRVAFMHEHDHRVVVRGVALPGQCLGRFPWSFSFLGVGVLTPQGLFPRFLVRVLSLVGFPVEIPEKLGKLRGIPVGVPIWEFWDESSPRWMETRPVVVGSR